jgi:uncharacterized membrane-anchored protein YitT (DUF2179 family)
MKILEVKKVDYPLISLMLNPAFSLRQFLGDFFFISLGIFSADFGLKGFLLPSGFIDGGVTGISLLTRALTHYPLSLLIIPPLWYSPGLL